MRTGDGLRASDRGSTRTRLAPKSLLRSIKIPEPLPRRKDGIAGGERDAPSLEDRVSCTDAGRYRTAQTGIDFETRTPEAVLVGSGFVGRIPRRTRGKIARRLRSRAGVVGGLGPNRDRRRAAESPRKRAGNFANEECFELEIGDR